jgi:hypothetical protein
MIGNRTLGPLENAAESASRAVSSQPHLFQFLQNPDWMMTSEFSTSVLLPL